MEIDEFPALDSNISVDVLIVGGGISGILLAYELKKKNIDYVLIEEDRIGDGISKNTTAFLTICHDYLYNQMIGDIGVSKAKEYLSYFSCLCYNEKNHSREESAYAQKQQQGPNDRRLCQPIY